MTRLYVDDHEVASPPPDLSTLADVLRHVELNYLAPDTVVRQVSVDGMPLGADEMASGRVQMRDSIEILTGSIHEVAAESIEEAVAYLERLEAGLPQLAADLLEFSGPSEFDSLKQLYEGLFWLGLLIDRLSAAFRIDLEQLSVGGASAEAHHRRFVIVLRRLLDAQEQEDYPALSALLESDILELLPIWKSMFLEIGMRTMSSEPRSQ